MAGAALGALHQRGLSKGCASKHMMLCAASFCMPACLLSCMYVHTHACTYTHTQVEEQYAKDVARMHGAGAESGDQDYKSFLKGHGCMMQANARCRKVRGRGKSASMTSSPCSLPALLFLPAFVTRLQP
eukprot:scaffold105226_cov18-Tisochrysis_lutea.AAC.1